MAKQTEKEWLETQGYLPKFMRDHHTQKDIFKWIWSRVEKSNEERKADGGGYDYLTGMNWIGAHIFVIDFFLWFMARHGYTLQRSRSRFPTADWYSSIKEMKDEEAESLKASWG